MLPYGIGLNSGSSDIERVREEKREERLNAIADREHEQLKAQATSSSSSTSTPAASTPKVDSVEAPPPIRSPDPISDDGPTPGPLLSSLHSSSTSAANTSSPGSTAGITTNSSDSIQH